MSMHPYQFQSFQLHNTLVWAHAVLTFYIYVYELVSQVIPTPSVQQASIEPRHPPAVVHKP